MGPPPDPDQMASMLENPAFSAQLNEALSNPDVVEQMYVTLVVLTFLSCI